MNQHEWVYSCYEYYLENYIEPGNPEDGIWENAHWPVPKCLGGTKTIPLLKEHHAVQGVLQSEEWNRCCVFSWEKEYLTGELLDLYTKWKSEHMKRVLANMTPEEIRERNRKSRDAQTPEQRSAAARKRQQSKGSRKRSEESKRARATQLANMTAEQRSELGRRMQAAMTPEQRSAARRKAWETRRRNQQGG